VKLIIGGPLLDRRGQTPPGLHGQHVVIARVVGIGIRVTLVRM
jgi:hypothetical protein